MKKPVKHLSVYDISELRRYEGLVEKHIGDYHEKYQKYKYNLEHAIRVINLMTRRQLELGVAVIDAAEIHAAQLLAMPIETYCKTVQYQAGKPFVCMVLRNNSSHDQWELSVPKLKDQGMENLVAPLLLIAKPRDEEAEGYVQYHPTKARRNTFLEDGIHYESNKSGWTIWFVDSEDMRLHWLDMCRTEVVFRMCLRMPPPPVDLSSYGL